MTGDLTYKMAVCCLAKGRELPAFLESLDLRSRITAVKAIESYMPMQMTESLFKTLVTNPGVMMTTMFKSTEIILDNMAVLARREMATWSPDDLIFARDARG